VPGPNAKAAPDSATTGAQGSVVFGSSLFSDQIHRYNDYGMSVIGICAHEFGHIVQYFTGVYQTIVRGQPTVKRLELHADFLAGYYLGFRKRSDPSLRVWSAGDTLHRIGDTNVLARDHHGTPEERVAAAESGLSLGLNKDVDVRTAVARATISRTNN
jgi:predicted metalloprotease